MQKADYYSHFLTTKTHILLALGLVMFFVTENPALFLTWLCIYSGAWMLLPMKDPFKTGAEKRVQEREVEEQKFEFMQRQAKLMNQLSPENATRYETVANACASEAADYEENEVAKSIIRAKLQELLWTYLRMLVMVENIEAYLGQTNEAEINKEIAQIEKEMAEIKPEKEKIREIKNTLLKTLKERKQSLEEAADNLEVLKSEARRLEHEIHMLRADSGKNNEMITARIDASMDSLQESKNIIRSMSSLEEMAMSLPQEAESLPFGCEGEKKKKRTRERA